MPTKKSLKKQEPYDDDDCEVCRLMRSKGGNVTGEELVKAMSLKNFFHLTFSHSQECENIV